MTVTLCGHIDLTRGRSSRRAREIRQHSLAVVEEGRKGQERQPAGSQDEEEADSSPGSRGWRGQPQSLLSC